MNPLPHEYHVSAEHNETQSLVVSADNLPSLNVSPPIQFGGPGDAWSPEDLQLAAVSSCLILSFKAIAAASHLEWLSISCDTKGTLDKQDRKVCFTAFTTSVKIGINNEGDRAKAERIIHKADETCLISNSLNAPAYLIVEIVVKD